MNEQYAVLVGDGAWAVACVHEGRAGVDPVELEPEAALGSRVAAVRQRLSEAGRSDQPIVLILPSSWCLCAIVATHDLGRGQHRRAMGFRLEEHLPISAEEVVADYVDVGGGESLGVCAELARLRPIVDAFEAGGVHVWHICPAALLAAAYAAGQQDHLSAALMRGDGYDLVELHEGRPGRWWWLGGDEAAVHDHVAGLAAPDGRSPRLAMIGCDEMGRQSGGAKPAERVTVAGVCVDQAAALHAARVVEGAASPWIDLRRDALAPPDPYQVYRRPLGALVVSVVVLLVCVCAAAQWRGRQYRAMTAQSVERQAEVFRSALPNQRVPSSIKARLLSETRKLAGLGGLTSDLSGATAAPSASALAQLREVLADLPADVRYRILDLSIQPDLVRLDGQALSHAEAERLAVALRQSGRYDVEPPKTQALKDGGVSFVFTAKPLAAAVSKGAGQ